MLLAVLLGPLPALAEAAPPDVTGIWDWHNRLQTKNGDIRDEEESWFLVQDGRSIHGRYQRKVTFLSTQAKPYQCNGLVRYQRVAVYRIQGKVEGSRITLKEVSVQVQPGPCDDGQRRLDSYEGAVESGALRIRWAGGTEVLKRRNLTGLWMGQTTRTVEGGDSATWTEVWRLHQDGRHVVGLRDRTDVRKSGDGQSYRCSHSLQIVRSVRWPLSGHFLSTHLVLNLGRPVKRLSPCERRHLAPGRLTLEMDYDPNKIKITSPDATLVLVRQDDLDPGVAATRASKEPDRHK